MKRAFLSLFTAATFLLSTGYLSAQFVAAQGQGQRQMQGKKNNNGKRNGPNDGTGNQGQGPKDGTGYGAKSGKRAGPQDGSGPQHTPQGQGRRSGRR